MTDSTSNTTDADGSAINNITHSNTQADINKQIKDIEDDILFLNSAGSIPPDELVSTGKRRSLSDEARMDESASGSPNIPTAIDRLEITICSLKSARNRLAPISKLPSELLCHIFKHVNGVDEEHERTRYEDGKSWRELNTITQICHTWRQIALGCPILWSCPVFRSQKQNSSEPGRVVEIAQEMIARSKGCPLSIHLLSESAYGYFTSLPPPILTSILTLTNVRELHLLLRGSPLTKLLRVISSPGTTAREMRSLVIEQPRRNETPHPPPDISSTILARQMPNLRYLDISKCDVQWSALRKCVPHELVSLALSRVSTPSRSYFFDLLSLTPNLEILYLEAALPALFDPDRDILQEKVSLPRLRSCTILSSTVSQCLDFQTHISYPATATMTKLYFRLSVTSEAHKHLLLSSCGITVDNPWRKHSCLSFTPSPFKAVLQLWDDDKPLVANVPLDPTVKIVISGSRDRRDGATPSYLDPSVLDRLSISGLEELTFGWAEGEPCQADALVNFFDRHRDITHFFLRCREKSVQSLFSALSSDIACLPKLSKLTLNKGALPQDRDSVKTFLRKRRDAGRMISKLMLELCFVMN